MKAQHTLRRLRAVHGGTFRRGTLIVLRKLRAITFARRMLGYVPKLMEQQQPSGRLLAIGLRTLDISTAYPLGALSFVSVTLFSLWLLHEVISPKRWLGLTLIVCGAALIV